MQPSKQNTLLNNLPWRQFIVWLSIATALLITADTLRIVFAPPARNLSSTFQDTSINVQVSQKFIWSYDECVDVTWTVTNADDVYLDGAPAPNNGQLTHCLSPTPPVAQPDSNTDDSWNYGEINDVYTTFSQYPDVVVMARVHDNIDTFSYVSAPIYVLTDDLLWLWRVLLTAALLVTAGYLWPVRAVKRSIHQVRNLARRNTAFAVFCGVFAVILVVFLTQTIYLLRILSLLTSYAAENGFVPVVFNELAVLQVVGVLALFAIASLFAGAAALRLLTPKLFQDDSLGYLAVALVLGQGILALIFLVLGIFGILTSINIYAVLLLSIAGGMLEWRHIAESTQHTLQRTWRLFSQENLVWQALLIISVLIILITTLRVVTNINWDGYTTYATQAKLIAATGGISETARGNDIHYAASGLVGEVTMGAAYSLAGDPAARMHSWVVFIMLIFVGMAITSELNFSKRGQIIAFVSLITSSLLYGMVGQGKVDIYGFAPALGAIFIALKLSRQLHPTTALLTGLLAGIAIIAKVTYLPTLGVFLVLLTILTVPASRWLQMWIFMAIGSLIPIGMFLLRNAIILDHPLAPITRAEDSIELVTAGTQRERLLRQSYIFYPLTWYGSYSNSRLTYLTPIWLIMLPLIIWQLQSRTSPRRQRVVIGVNIVTIIVWVLSWENILPLRYQAAIFAMFLLLGSEALSKALGNTTQRLARFALITSLFFALFSAIVAQATLISGNFISPAAPYGCNPPPTTLCEGIDLLNTVAPQNSRVLTNMPLYYTMREDLLRCRAEQSDHIRLIQQTPEQIWTDLYENGFSYAVDWNIPNIWHDVNRQYIQIYPVVPLYPEAAPDWLTVTTRFESNDMRLYELTADAPPTPSTAENCTPR